MYSITIQIICINNPLKNTSFDSPLVNIIIGKNVQYIKGKTPNTFKMDFGNKSMGKTLPDKKSSKISFKTKNEVTSVIQNTSKLIIVFMQKFRSRDNSSITGKSSNCPRLMSMIRFEDCIKNTGINVIITIKS